VTFTGMLTGETKWGAFRCADVFALPSHQENFGIAIAESLACGVPVLISDKVNIWREILEAEAGYVESDTVSGTTTMLARFLALADESQARMRRNALALFRGRYEISAAVRNIMALIDDQIGQAGARETCADHPQGAPR
jgi:glycosyltransferase involved in cell wall biosynthesis